MSLFIAPEKQFAKAIAALSYCNPFLPERIEFERQALGQFFDTDAADWNVSAEHWQSEHANVEKLIIRTRDLLHSLRDRFKRLRSLKPEDLQLYEDLVFFDLYHQFRKQFDATIERGLTRKSTRVPVAYYGDFHRGWLQWFDVPAVGDLPHDHCPHFFASLFQVRRAFYHIYTNIVGSSQPVVRLRAAIWQSIFTHDMRRYRRVLYNRMGDLTTLVTGPSGTGKELVARAIGLSRHIPFDPARNIFTEDFAGAFFPLNLSALSPTLIESELFGHRRGSFTGAVTDRVGWLQLCPPLGTVFLDEIGDLDVAIQVKLLRVLQSRTFQRLGDTRDYRFEGKIIAATNVDMGTAIQAGRFRGDFYYRLCSDLIVTPSLADQLRDKPEDLHLLVTFLAKRFVGDEEETTLAKEVEQWVNTQLGPDYAWPGNVRELEQCVRNILIRKEYHPTVARRRTASDTTLGPFLEEGDVMEGRWSADQLLIWYCSRVYWKTGSFQAAAARLGLDRRTVKAKIDDSLLAQWNSELV